MNKLSSKWNGMDLILEEDKALHFDQHGQPLSALNRGLRDRRSEDELIGICKGIISDGNVSQQEAEYIESWFMHNPDINSKWPFNKLKENIESALRYGELKPDGARDLLIFLRQMVGAPPDRLDAISMTSELPLDKPQPQVIVSQRRFCLTGRFVHGVRRECEALIISKGGFVQSDVTTTLDYLVIGKIGSRDWVHTSHGTKIEKALKFKESRKAQIAVISELTFLQAFESH